MPQLHAEAPDLATSPDGKWVAERQDGTLCLYRLDGPVEAPTPCVVEETLTGEPRPGRVFFVQNDRLLNLSVGETEEGKPPEVLAELLQLPQLTRVGKPIRVAGAQRILFGGTAGAVVAPSGAGAELLIPREHDVVAFKLFVRGEVLSAGQTPDKRILLEQRSGFEIWDTQTRRAAVRLSLSTRQPPLQLGFLSDGRMVWALTCALPMRIEVFRVSDGLRFFEIDRPGRALAVESAPGRLFIAVEEEDHLRFLDFDLAGRTLKPVAIHPEVTQPLGFVVTQNAKQPELLLRVPNPDQPMWRLPLPRLLQNKTSASHNGRNPGGATGARAAGLPLDATRSAPRPLREQRPESRAIRRLAEAETLHSEAKPEHEHDPADFRRSSVSPNAGGTDAEEHPPGVSTALPGPARAEAEPPPDELEPTIVPLLPEVTLGGPATGLLPMETAQPKLPPPLRAFDAQKSPATWQWELLRWAHAAMVRAENPELPPAGPLAELAVRLQLTPTATRVLGLLYAAQVLLGTKPHGLRPFELATALCGQADEPDVLSEALPAGALFGLDLLVRRPDGRLKLRHEVLLRLSGTQDKDVQWPQTTARETLGKGLYLLDGPALWKPARVLGRPVLRLDGLQENQPEKCLPSLLRRALLSDAVLSVDGIAGLSFPDFAGRGFVAKLKPLLQNLQTPVVLWAMPEAAAMSGLAGRKLAETGVVREGSAPTQPSGPLPSGVLWKAPSPTAKMAVSPRPTGQVQPMQENDRRAALVVGPTANAEAYAHAAYLAARDGAVLSVETELTPPRATLLSLLLRQIPVVVAATPNDGIWPQDLRPYL